MYGCYFIHSKAVLININKLVFLGPPWVQYSLMMVLIKLITIDVLWGKRGGGSSSQYHILVPVKTISLIKLTNTLSRYLIKTSSKLLTLSDLFIYFFEKKLNLISSNLGAPQILNLFFLSIREWLTKSPSCDTAQPVENMSGI